MIAGDRMHELKAGIVREFLAQREKENHPDTVVGFLAFDVGNVRAIMHISAREEARRRRQASPCDGGRSRRAALFAEEPRIYE